MKISFSINNYRKVKADLLIVPVYEGDPFWFNEIDDALDGNLRDELVRTGYDAGIGKVLWVENGGKIGAKKILLLGLGDPTQTTNETIRRWTGTIVAQAQSVVAKKVAIIAPKFNDTDLLTRSLAEGLWLAEYKFLDYKKEEADKAQEKAIEQAVIMYDSDISRADEIIKEAAIGVLGTTLARDLVNQPSNIISPKYLTDVALNIAEESSNIDAVIHDQKALEKFGFGAFLAVAQGSDEKPYLIHLQYKGKQKPLKRITLVGKGITFDSGGLSLKPQASMDDMKIDMAGAAIVLGVFRALELLDLPLEIHGIIPVCENMPSGKAIRPGDVVTSYSGKTIEIANTDAEGRLILADALSYAAKTLAPDALIDLSTLTGAAMVALGESVAAVMSDHEELVASLVSAATKTGENLWRLPLVRDYQKKYRSEIADIKNIPEDKWAGAIMGGLFLQEFVDPAIPYAHIDVAGPVWDKKGTLSYNPKGATGYGVRLILEWLKELS